MARPTKDPYIYKRGNIYYAFFSRDERISLETSDPTKAQIRFGELLQRPRLPQVKKEKDVTLSNLAAEVYKRAQVNHTPKTAYIYHCNITRVLVWLEANGYNFPRNLTESTIADYKDFRKAELDAGKSKNPAAMINRELDAVIKTLKLAAGPDYGLISEEFLDVVRAAKMREPKPAPLHMNLTREDLEAFFKNVDPDYGSMFRLVLGSGMRTDEVLHMGAEDIREASIVVTPKEGWTTKGYRYREIPCSPTTIAAARRFLDVRGKLTLESKTVWKVIQKACSDGGIKPFSLHFIRKAYASYLLDKGIKIAVISKLLGHADLVTTMRYLGMVEDMPQPKDLPW